MKSVLILRHAKSSWKQPERTDHDRPLNDRGKADAPRIGRLLKARGLEPEVVLCSTAKRARKTAAKVVKASGLALEVELFSELYLAAPESYIELIRSQPEEYHCIMVVGHNPGLEQLQYLLTGELQAMPTAALAVVDLDIDSWMQFAGDGTGTLRGFYRPRELPDDL